MKHDIDRVCGNIQAGLFHFDKAISEAKQARELFHQAAIAAHSLKLETIGSDKHAADVRQMHVRANLALQIFEGIPTEDLYKAAQLNGLSQDIRDLIGDELPDYREVDPDQIKDDETIKP